MSVRTSAARYARALLEVATAEADPEKVERDLAGFVNVLEAHGDVRHALTSPRIPSGTRRQIVERIAQKTGMEAPLGKLLALLAERGRIELLRDLLDVYRERLLAHHSIVRGSVTSAAPLAPEKVQALERSLSQATGKKVQLDVSVDPSLIGGVVARIGSTVYDGSIKAQLQRMKQQLIENVS